MKTPTKCPQCGHRFTVAPPVAAAAYNTDALTRIKNGATARDLGWDENFYISVCRKHGLEQTRAPKAIAPSVAPVEAEPPPPGAYVFHKPTLELSRGDKIAPLSRRQAEMLLVFVAQPGKPIGGADYAERIGISVSNVSGYINQLRHAIEPAGLFVLGIMGRKVGGYLLIDQKTREPATIHVVSE